MRYQISKLCEHVAMVNDYLPQEHMELAFLILSSSLIQIAILKHGCELVHNEF